ncbi:MAG: (d)CMP kinase [Oscillospiraceae bacterium]|jgi:cytidylate kinase|nr:(d)CMP kinase [Oscillospiraceae bacterium]
MPQSIAIDGPAGAGKSTLGKALAEQLGFVYVDTGALYRAVGYYVWNKRGDKYTEDDVVADLQEIEIEQQLIDGHTEIYLNGLDISKDIRDEKISMVASRVSGFKEVRRFLLGLQRKLAEKSDVVMDGRDIGTVVLPNADIKIFLTASCEVRATRRKSQLEEAGKNATYDEVLQTLKERDHNDSNRQIAPLKSANDAHFFDNSEKSFEEALQELYELVREG